MTIWKKGSRSNGSGGNNCVEVAMLPDGGARVRDSKLGSKSPILQFTHAEWAAFIESVKLGEFNA